jgi:hypothetical protein
MTTTRFALVLAGAIGFACGTASGTTMMEQQFICPVGGEKFEDFVIGSYTSWGQRPDGRSYGTLPIYPIVECPGNGFLLFEEEFSPQDVARLEPLVASAEYQAMRRAETPHFRVWWLMEKLGRDPYDRTGALLRASWESDEDTERKARYQTAFIAAATALTPTPEQAETWFWFNLRAANALRELGDFARAEAVLAEVAGNPWPADEEEREGAEYLIEGLRPLIAEGNAVAEPTNLVPPRMAVERCTTQAAALSASEREACATPAAREAIAEEAEYRAQEASGKFGEATAEAIVAEAEAAAAAAAADAADSATALKAGRPKAARKGQ